MKPIDIEAHFPWYVDSADTDNLDCQCGAACDGIAGWATHVVNTLGMEERMIAALNAFGQAWSSGYLADDLADKLSCDEVDALAGLLRAVGHAPAAERWLAEHSTADDCGDQHCRCPHCTDGGRA